jgi:hypothetical protein
VDRGGGFGKTLHVHFEFEDMRGTNLSQQVVEMDTFCNRPCENLARITVRAVVYAPRGNDVRKSEDERSQAMRALSRNRMHWRERFNSFEAHWAKARRCRTCGGASGATPMSSCFFGRETYAYSIAISKKNGPSGPCNADLRAK